MSKGLHALQSKSSGKLRWVIGCCPNDHLFVWIVDGVGNAIRIARQNIPKAYNGWVPERFPEAFPAASMFVAPLHLNTDTLSQVRSANQRAGDVVETVCDRVRRKLGYLLEDYPDDKETRNLLIPAMVEIGCLLERTG